jgi:serine/threonine protein kinase
MAVGYLPPRFDKYKNGQEQLNFFPRSWENLDFINLKDLIEKCLKYEPENRISVEVALNHPWFDVEL